MPMRTLYFFVITDANGCPTTSATVAPPTNLYWLIASQVNVSCNGGLTDQLH
jgi:hypothetical protein